MGTVILAIVLRMVLIFHVTFCINSFAHTFGSAHYDYHSSGRDHWLAALLTNGEGYHNYHHRFPSDYRNGIRWYHWDPSKWLIWTLAQIGLASHLRRIPVFHPRRASGNGSGARWRGPICRKGPGRGAHAIRARRTRSAGPAWATLHKTKRPTRSAERLFKSASFVCQAMAERTAICRENLWPSKGPAASLWARIPAAPPAASRAPRWRRALRWFPPSYLPNSEALRFVSTDLRPTPSLPDVSSAPTWAACPRHTSPGE